MDPRRENVAAAHMVAGCEDVSPHVELSSPPVTTTVIRCEHCGGPLPDGSRRGTRYCSKSCRQAAYDRRKGRYRSELSSSTERDKLYNLRENLGHRLVELSPDRRAAVRLRCELARDRRENFDFDAVFDDECYYATAGLDRAERETWTQVFNEQRDIWRDAYYRSVPSVCALSETLIAA
jgi:hypothetical protein